MDYRVRPIEPAVDSDADILKQLWGNNLPAPPMQLDTKLRWIFHDAPHGAARAFVVGADDHIVGCTGYGVRKFFDRSRGDCRVAVFGDLAVDRNHRSAFPALALVRACSAEVQREFALGYGFPNMKAAPIYIRGGYELLDGLARYVRPLRSERFVGSRLGRRFAAIATGAIDRVLAALTRLAALPSRLRYELRFDPPIDERFDELWREARMHNAFACERSAAYLRWRLAYERHLIVALCARGTGALRAYLVLRSDVTGGLHIVDLFAVDDVTRFALLTQLLHAATAAGAPAVSMRFLGDPRVTRVLGQLGFVRRPDRRAVILLPGYARVDDLRDPSRWYLTDLDEDI